MQVHRNGDQVVRGSSHGELLFRLLTAEEQEELVSLCGRCLYNSLTRALKVVGDFTLQLKDLFSPCRCKFPRRSRALQH
jgi:hypothetical protein